jgi:hypothetical protein
MQIQGRTRVLIGVLATAFALVVPSAAFAGHDLGIYKVEKHVDINSDDQSVDLSCYGGDYALDGMWRIDHADQDDDDLFVTSIGRAVDVQEAYPFDGPAPTTHRDSYHFVFNKNAIGRAQVKVFATCIKQQTEQSGGHSHAIPVTVNPPVVRPVGLGDFDNGTVAICPINTFIAQTGYKITPSGDPVPFVGHISEDWPILNMRGWSWKMDISQDPGAFVTYYTSCVGKKLPLAGGEKHKLVYRLQGPETNSLAASRVSTKRISCAAHYKAVVAGFSFWPTGPGSMSDPNTDYGFVPKLWWLGMDPQPKSRDFKFLNSFGAVGSVDLKAICLNYRTT